MSQKQRNGWCVILCEYKISHILIASDKAFSSEKNDTKIIEIGLVLLILWSFLETQSFSVFPGFDTGHVEEYAHAVSFILSFVVLSARNDSFLSNNV